MPLDAPHPGRPHRVYLALTNHCNRSCPWCSTCSSPRGSTWLGRAAWRAVLPDGDYELQLEGGEPTLHPDFLHFVDAARADPRCRHLVVCTNGTTLPRAAARLAAWLERLGEPVTVKLSLNHHLLAHDPGLPAAARALGAAARRLGGARRVVCNVRLRPRSAACPDGDAAVLAAIRAAGLEADANVFDLQAYGFARDQAAWAPPVLAGHDFRLINPDGRNFGTALVARSDAMEALP